MKHFDPQGLSGDHNGGAHLILNKSLLSNTRCLGCSVPLLLAPVEGSMALWLPEPLRPLYDPFVAVSKIALHVSHLHTLNSIIRL